VSSYFDSCRLHLRFEYELRAPVQYDVVVCIWRQGASPYLGHTRDGFVLADGSQRHDVGEVVEPLRGREAGRLQVQLLRDGIGDFAEAGCQGPDPRSPSRVQGLPFWGECFRSYGF